MEIETNNNSNKIEKGDFLNTLKTSLEVILSLFTVFYILNNTEETIEISFAYGVGLILYIMIFIEMYRALFDFVFDKEHKLKVRYIYDMGIIFIIRELLVLMTEKTIHFDHYIVLIITLILLVIVRRKETEIKERIGEYKEDSKSKKQ
jgi:uncharacterized membrane protein (DUF373 family)